MNFSLELIQAQVLSTAASNADPVAAAVTSFLADLGTHDDAIVGEATAVHEMQT